MARYSSFVRHEGFFTTSLGPCAAFIPPRQIVVGATFAANGKERTIGAISATQADHDFEFHGLEMKKGEWFCVAGETEADIDPANDHSALWLSVMKCQPIS